MKCETVREALSARIDGEAEPIPAEVTDRHLAACPACRGWCRSAETLRRTMIVRTAPQVPDLTAAILGELPPARRAPQIARVALAAVAVAQTGLAVAQLVGADTGMGDSHGAFMLGHMTHESAAWNLAVGIGLIWAALRIRTAAAQLPMLGVFVGALTGASLLDLIRGDVTVGRLATHIPVLVGVALLYLVHRQHRDDGQPGHRRSATDPEYTDIAVTPLETPPRIPATDIGYHRPASRHRVA
ncbi:zf-HC2 domain-containing protein [Nocardia spumae]|uniref:zf-HC2 domain-containing protein n=1 Tax=Nocardia spumae TaxID=2887190 RepID=UPI001D15CED7|nr:zf-HC2 domain-containing protein [Nocardia spumae]